MRKYQPLSDSAKFKLTEQTKHYIDFDIKKKSLITKQNAIIHKINKVKLEQWNYK